MKLRNFVFQYLLFSIFSIILLIIIILKNPSVNVLTFNDRLFIGTLFIISCLIGISLAFYPGWIKRHLKKTTQSSNKKNNKKTARNRIGHHPDCDIFNNHRIRIKNKIYCAGCLGLSIGCLISIILMLFYIPNFFTIPSGLSFYLIFLGFFIIGIVFVEIIINNRNTIIHIISNSLLVIGFFILIINIVESTGNKNYGLISIIFSFLWLDTRIQLSSLHHNRICKSCNKTCKMY